MSWVRNGAEERERVTAGREEQGSAIRKLCCSPVRGNGRDRRVPFALRGQTRRRGVAIGLLSILAEMRLFTSGYLIIIPPG
ncbi:hypothetical protein AAFF_G00219390 [Aldrovandia affinis]|uniref:Uncharacterized protein n=1 Tax=Aldrovandia affinis TaxID=143900 RepID=A0AAD7RG37_9TELE|nr:hypothetical protein AAFF_G00219390 [Aldrovandia affinis]